jgi:hypothetical protein
VFELVISFLKYTGLKPETFGRLTVNDADLVWKLEQGMQFEDEVNETILRFMQRYEDAKE